MNYKSQYRKTRETISGIQWTPGNIVLLAIGVLYFLPLAIYFLSTLLFWKLHSLAFGRTPSRAGDAWSGLPFYGATIAGVVASVLWSFWLAHCAYRWIAPYAGNPLI